MSGDLDGFYREQWGERWESLRASLTEPERQVARRSLFSDVPIPGLTPFAPDHFAECFEVSDDLRQAIPRGSEGLLGFYIMDPASVWIARALGVQPGDTVLDQCAAPGGKTLILIESLREQGEILANEPSPGRRDRLVKVIQQYVPRDVRDRVRVTGKDGGLFAKSHPETFDRILVDAPCSGERHLLRNKAELENWSWRRSERLAQGQYALLTAALEALRPGGTIVYSTCALSKLENDAVIARLLKKKKDRFVVDELVGPNGAEKSEFGLSFLPDRAGYGPLYVSRLRKN